MPGLNLESASVSNGEPPVCLTEGAAYSPDSRLVGLSFADKRTALLVHSALSRTGRGEAVIRLARRYLLDAGVMPLLTALRTGSGFTFRHSLRTMEFAMAVAAKMELDDTEQAVVCVGALLHDIGKLSLPIDLLMATRRLRESEIAKIRTHAEVGYELVCDARILGWNAVLDIIRYHHEFLDGTGYPFGLTAPRISRRTRCVTVCDVFCALTEDRPYRPAMSEDEAFSIMAEMTAAGKLDGGIVDILRSVNIGGATGR